MIIRSTVADMKRRNHGALAGTALAVFVWLALAGANAYWLTRDSGTAFSADEAADHAVASVRTYQRLADEGSVVDRLRMVARQADPYPPLVSVVASAEFALGGLPAGGPSIAVTVWILGALFLGLVVIVTYAFGNAVAGPRAGAVAAFLVATSPVVFSQARYFMLDVPLTAVVTLSLWLLWRTDGFHDTSHALLFGVAAGAGMLTKQAYGLFLIGPVMWTIVDGIRRRREGPDRPRRIANAAVAIAAAVAVCGWWYAAQAHAGRSFTWFVYNPHDVGAAECAGRVFTLCGLTYYIRALNNTVSFSYLLLFAAAIVTLVKARRRSRSLGFVAVWLSAGYLILTVFDAKQPRFMLPLLPAVAVVSAAGMEALFDTRAFRSTAARRAFVGAMACVGAVQFVAISFGLPWLPQGSEERLWGGARLVDPHWFPNPFFQRYAYGPHPRGTDWKTAQILDLALARYDARCPGHREVLMGIQSPELLDVVDPLFYEAAVRAPFLTVLQVSPPGAAGYGPYSFVVLHTGDGETTAQTHAMPALEPLGHVDLPRGRATLYLNRDTLSAAMRADALWGSIGVAAESDGHLVVTENYRHCIAEFTQDGRLVRDWGGEGQRPGRFEQPRGIAADRRGNLYVADFGNNRIQVFDRRGRLIRAFGSWGNRPGELDGPWGIAVAANGTIFVSDTRNNRMQAFDPEGNFLRSWGELGAGRGALGRLQEPRDVALGQAGTLYVVDAGNFRVMKFTQEGRYVADWGSRGTGDGQFVDPVGIWVDQTGVYVTDKGRGAARVQRFDLNGRFLAVIRNGIPPSPMDVVRTPDGTLYCTDFEGTGLVRLGHIP